MAIGTPTERKAVTAAAQTTTTAFSPATTIAAGTVAILCATGNANKSISSVADSTGANTWHVDATGGDGTRTTSFASAQIVTQITTSDTITITWSNATSGGIDYWVQEVTGLATSSVIDKSAANSGTTGTISTGSTGTLSQADEIAFVLFRTGNAAPGAWTKGAAWTNPTTPSLSSARSSLEYQIVAATTALNGGGSWGTSGNPWVGGIATYKEASVVDDSITGVRATATATAQTGFITEGIVGQRATATAAAQTGFAKIAVIGLRSAATASINAGTVTEGTAAGMGSRRLLTGMGV